MMLYSAPDVRSSGLALPFRTANQVQRSVRPGLDPLEGRALMAECESLVNEHETKN